MVTPEGQDTLRVGWVGSTDYDDYIGEGHAGAGAGVGAGAGEHAISGGGSRTEGGGGGNGGAGGPTVCGKMVTRKNLPRHVCRVHLHMR
jgi:hypothetical protein